MRSAAEHLTPVTLELGGKSPTIICDDFDVDEAASRIMYGKLINAGQTCLAPDYLFVPEGKRERFVEAARRVVAQRYPDTNDRSFTAVIDDKSYRRLRQTLEDAERKGAQIVPLVPGAAFNDVQRKFPPHLVLDPTDDMTIMREEIFGPLLPVKTYRDLDEVLQYVNSKDRPLGFYFFTHDKQIEHKLLYGTISGGRDDQQLHPARRPARSAVRRHRRQRHGPVPRPRGIPRGQQAAAGVHQSALVTAAALLSALQAHARPGARLHAALRAVMSIPGGLDQTGTRVPRGRRSSQMSQVFRLAKKK